MKLYEILPAMQEIADQMLAQASENDGEVSEDLVSQLEALKTAKDEKVFGIIRLYKNNSADADALEAEAKKLASRAKTHRNLCERLKNYLSQTVAGEKYADATGALGWRKSESVEVSVTPDQLPINLVRQKIEPDRVAIKELLKAGTVVPGCHIVEKISPVIK